MDDGTVLWRAGSAVCILRKLSDGRLEVDVYVDEVLMHREQFTRGTGPVVFAIAMRERYDSTVNSNVDAARRPPVKSDGNAGRRRRRWRDEEW
jgi:hypothetical protein